MGQKFEGPYVLGLVSLRQKSLGRVKSAGPYFMCQAAVKQKKANTCGRYGCELSAKISKMTDGHKEMQ